MKKNIIIMVLFIVIFVLCIFLGISMNKKCVTPVNTLDTGDDSVEYLESTNEEVQSLIDNITTGVGSPCGLSNIYFKNNKITVSEISSEDLFRIAVKQISSDYRVNFSIDTVRSKIKNTFGSKIQFKDQTYNIIPRYTYNYETATYEYQDDTGIEKVCKGDKNLFSVVKAMKKASKFEIHVRVLFNRSGAYYSDPTYSNVLTNLDKTGNIVNYSDYNMRQGSLYKITFNKENNHYIFVSSEIVR